MGVNKLILSEETKKGGDVIGNYNRRVTGDATPSGMKKVMSPAMKSVTQFKVKK